MIEEFRQRLQKYPVGGDDRKWFVTWIIRYRQFGGYASDAPFVVDRESTISFCQQLLGHETPAWQRLQAVRRLIAYLQLIVRGDDDLLGDIRSKLADRAAQESVRGVANGGTQSEPPIEDGPAAAQEPRFITELRRTMRRRRLKYDTEKAYTGWLVRFARWAKVDDPSGLGEAELREFLTDVAVMPIRRMHHHICRLC